ncbi:MAG: hypothetical protein MUE72_06455 [Chitinophagaceae bacterium]|jgi:hypothetical protein|nr:hypothetical protein [Chitinophagaceae bacterium]
MSTKEIREEIVAAIQKMPEQKLSSFYSLLQSFLNGEESNIELWQNLPSSTKKRINESIKQADNDEVMNAFESIQNIKQKLGLHA